MQTEGRSKTKAVESIPITATSRVDYLLIRSVLMLGTLGGFDKS